MRTNRFRLLVGVAPLAWLAAGGAPDGTTAGTQRRVLQPDALDAAAPTSVEDAARAAAMAEQMAAHAHHMNHGSYSHVDAGRVPATSPVPRQSPAPPPAPAHGEHGVAPATTPQPPPVPAAAPAAAPEGHQHHMHHPSPARPSPSPSPSPRPTPKPKEDQQ